MVSSTKYSLALEASWDEESDNFMKESREKAAQKAKEFEGTCPHAGKEPPCATISAPLIASLLPYGFCVDGSDGLEILDGVIFKRSALARLNTYYNFTGTCSIRVRSAEYRSGFGQDHS